MAVRVDKPGKQGPALAVDARSRAFGRRLAGVEQAHDLAVVADQQGVEMLRAGRSASTWMPLTLIDQRVGERLADDRERSGESEEGVLMAGA